MAKETIRVEGLAGVLETLKQLPPEIVSKSGGPVRISLLRAAQVIQKQAQANVQAIIDAPNKGGNDDSIGLLKKSIISSRSKPLGGAKGEAYLVRVRRNRKYPPGRSAKKEQTTAAQVGALLERGTEKRKAYPWMRPAFDEKKGEAVETFVREINARIAKIVKKLEKQNAGKR